MTTLNEGTGVRYPTITTSAGIYEIPQLPPGRYTVTVEVNGFKTFVRQGLEFGAGARMRVDVKLELGAAGQTVTVSSAAPLVQSETAEIGASFSQQQFDALPIGRDPTSALALVPGAHAGTLGYETAVYNGSREEMTDYQIDGAPATDSNIREAPQAPPIEEMVEQVVMQSGNYSAESGRGSSVISVNTIAGTNQFHGALFEYFQNEDLNANSFFNNLLGQPRSLHRLNQFGGTIGGPLVVPRIYNGHDRTFFTFGVQALRAHNPGQNISTVPSAAQRAGNFAGLATIYDPATTTQSSTGAFTRTPFPGNVIPSARFDPVALNLLANAWPLPNEPGVANNFAVTGAIPTKNTQFQVRLDENFSQKNRLTARFSRWYQQITNLDRWPGPSGVVSTSTSQDVFYQFTIVSLEDSYVIRPNLVNTLRFGYYFDRWNQLGPGMLANWAAQVGLKGAGPQEFPAVSITGLTGFGGGALLLMQPGANISLADSVLLVKGHHSLKVGFEFRRVGFHQYFPASPSGNFTFNTLATNNPTGASGGNAMASFLLGLPSTSANQAIYPTNGFAVFWPYYAAFVQDDFRVNKKLTLNLGLRWEANMPFTEEHNQLSNFNTAIGQLQLAGQDGYPRTVYDPFYKGFSPRFGLAYSPFGDDKTVIRGGYGIFFVANSVGGQPFTAGPWNQTFSYVSQDNGITFHIRLATGFPVVNPTAPLVLIPAISLGNDSTQRNYTPPYMQQWNLNVQRQIGSHSMLQVGYVGNKGNHLDAITPLNQVPSNLLGPGNAQLLRPFPNLGNFSAGSSAVGWANSHYEALQVQFIQRLQHGFSFRVAYTFSKAIDYADFDATANSFGTCGGQAVQNANDLRAEKSLACTDQPHALALGFVWQLPFGKGRAFLQSRGLGALLGGWNLSSISSLGSGSPLTMSTVQNLTGSLGGGSRPNRLTNGALSGAHRSIYEWFNPSAFAVPAAYTFGNDSRTESQILSPGSLNVNMMLSKEFRFSERFWAEFRCEADNAINHFNPGVPNMTIGNPGAGTITTGNAGRSLLLNVRLHY